MQVGKKIYYEKLTGNVILETSEMQGDVRQTTQEEDFQIFKALSNRNPEAVGCIQLEYGQYSDKFGFYNYHVDIVTRTIVWGNLINPDIVPPGPTLEEMQMQTLLNTEYLVVMSEITSI